MQFFPNRTVLMMFFQAAGGVYEELKSEDRLPGVQPQLSRASSVNTAGRNSSVFFSTSIQGNYAIAPAAATGQQQQQQHKFNTIVLQK